MNRVDKEKPSSFRKRALDSNAIVWTGFLLAACDAFVDEDFDLNPAILCSSGLSFVWRG
jgi:hypothetical protein